jgi:hypothetical protein
MGYYMEQGHTVFNIKKENEALALQAIKDLMSQSEFAKSATWDNGTVIQVPAFSWVNTQKVNKASTLDEALRAWRWMPSREDNDEINWISFQGEKLGDDFYLFHAIAPFVEDGSYIIMRGEDEAIWKWAFQDGKVRELEGKIVFPEE